MHVASQASPSAGLGSSYTITVVEDPASRTGYGRAIALTSDGSGIIARNSAEAIGTDARRRAQALVLYRALSDLHGRPVQKVRVAVDHEQLMNVVMNTPNDTDDALLQAIRSALGNHEQWSLDRTGGPQAQL